MLQARGVRVEGGYGAGAAPKGAKTVGAIDSPPLRRIITELLTESDNQTAELLTKELGRVKGSGGTTAAGVQVIDRVIRRLGLPTAGVQVTDGSGLDDGDHVTCSFLAALLARTGRHSPLGDSLPVAGQTGTLANRFVASPAKGRLRAKTGTLNTVSALAGYVDTIPGTTLTFSYIATGANRELRRSCGSRRISGPRWCAIPKARHSASWDHTVVDRPPRAARSRVAKARTVGPWPCPRCFRSDRVLFPSAVLPLHVFEPRYMALVHTCLEGDREFGVVLIAGERGRRR